MIVSPEAEKGRIKSGPMASQAGDLFGAFSIPGPCANELFIIASCGDEIVRWEHVSVSLRNRTPNWKEMCFVKDLFWMPEEGVIQFHPPKSDYINVHENCLHMWRPLDFEIKFPPIVAV